MLMRFNNRDTGGDNLLSHIYTDLRSTNLRCMLLKNIIPGPRLSVIGGNMRLYHRRGISFVLTINNNDIVSDTGNVNCNLTGPKSI